MKLSPKSTFEYQISAKSVKGFCVGIAIENYIIWNWLKNFTDPYTFSDFKSHFIWPEYYNQCFADKTDHLEWEVSDAGLTILNGTSLGLDYYILVGLIKYRFWISDTSISWPSLIYAIETYSICNWMKSSTDDPYAISDLSPNLSG